MNSIQETCNELHKLDPHLTLLEMVRCSYVTIDGEGATTITREVIRGKSAVAVVSGRDPSSYEDLELDPWTTQNGTPWSVLSLYHAHSPDDERCYTSVN